MFVLLNPRSISQSIRDIARGSVWRDGPLQPRYPLLHPRFIEASVPEEVCCIIQKDLSDPINLGVNQLRVPSTENRLHWLAAVLAADQAIGRGGGEEAA